MNTQIKTTTYDWEAIERLYRENRLSVNEIADQYGCAASSISHRARRKGWSRNLSKVISAEVADRLIRKEQSLNKKENARLGIELAVEERINIILRHRTISKKGAELVKALMDELHDAIEHRDEIEQAIEDETQADRDGKRRQMMLRAVGLPARAATVDKLASAITKFIEVERKAYNMDEAAPPAPPADELERKREMRAELARLLSNGARNVTPSANPASAAPIPAIIDGTTGKPV